MVLRFFGTNFSKDPMLNFKKNAKLLFFKFWAFLESYATNFITPGEMKLRIDPDSPPGRWTEGRSVSVIIKMPSFPSRIPTWKCVCPELVPATYGEEHRFSSQLERGALTALCRKWRKVHHHQIDERFKFCGLLVGFDLLNQWMEVCFDKLA